jgi:hypothetical protein
MTQIKTGAFTRWFKYDRDDLCVNKSQFVPVILEPPCTFVNDRDFRDAAPCMMMTTIVCACALMRARLCFS